VWQAWIARSAEALSAEGEPAARRQLIRAWQGMSAGVLATVSHLYGWTIPGAEVQACLIGLQESARGVLAAAEDLWPAPPEGDGDG
jgi:hypothetical protein